MRIRNVSCLAVALLLLGGGVARADFSFVFTDGSGNTVANNAFSVNQGSTLNIQIWLLESNGETRLRSPGLNTGGVKLTYNQTIANVTTVTGNTGTGAFDMSTNNIGTGSAIVRDFQTNNTGTGVVAPSTGTNADRILLGTFTFTGVSPGSTSTLTALPDAGAIPPISDNTLNDSPTFTSLDSLIQNSSAVITVTAVPEPGSLALVTLFSAGMVGMVIRRLRRKAG
jgi:hypothetical protein